ncbi:hypothetical protein GGR54DRAFT_18026 [Hypoxylon sp. NC1633]|nr:hypothetical protein GGR54DRAFT_18026 [Hypoxylon sp. NC1633]
MASSMKASARFRADLKLATEQDIPNILNIKKGDAEDEFVVTFSHPNLPHPYFIEIRIQPQDVRGYPSDSTFLVYTSDDIPAAVAQVLEDSMYDTTGMNVEDMLAKLSRRLRTVLENDRSAADNDVEMADADASDFDDEGFSDHSFDDLLFDDSDHYDDFGIGSSQAPLNPVKVLSPELLQRVRRDLVTVLLAGFHTGRVCGFEESIAEGIISVSIRAGKLCLSKATRDAWGFDSSDYIVLLIKHNGRYTTFDDVMKEPAKFIELGFRLRKCSKKKPSYEEAVAAFSPPKVTEQDTEQPSEDAGLSRIWMSASIDEFMNKEFVSLLKLRAAHDVSWDSAKEILRTLQTLPGSSELRSSMDATLSPAPTQGNGEGGNSEGGNERGGNKTQLPHFLANDHLLNKGEKSLPLLAVQFALYHLVKCTDHCTICHRKVKDSFEAISPYVCSEPLCLHQHLNLGLSASIEYEIINQPHVVDLLISFCYASLAGSLTSPHNSGMREFPTGLNIQVPKIRRPTQFTLSTEAPRLVSCQGADLVEPVDVIFHRDSSAATITGNESNVRLTEGQWIVIATPFKKDEALAPRLALHHARIKSKVGQRLELEVVSQHQLPDGFQVPIPETFDSLNRYLDSDTPSHLVLYSDELDDMDSNQAKAFSMLIILESLPSVTEMGSYLKSGQLPQLSKWDRMSRSAVDLLRWIIASNRSYIVQVDNEDPEKIFGVDGWLQFRFAQGSAEKEILFSKALEDVTEEHKTLVAWHGSPLANWHSIIRQGLNYTVMANGRSFGNGVYFSKAFDTSLSYAGFCQTAHTLRWPRSTLKITSVISLNELVNRTKEFRSTHPHFVVCNCHWIQCRYLFVKPQDDTIDEDLHPIIPPAQHKMSLLRKINPYYAKNEAGHKAGPGKVPQFIQNPTHEATGPMGHTLFIPKNAVPSARGDLTEEDAETSGMASSDEDEEDQNFIFHKDANIKKETIYKTDFRPWTLDYSNLPQLAPPSYATEMAQKALGQEIKKLVKTQSTTPLHELGWFIDFERISNMFQWIVELHSFDPSLPLAKDMKIAGLTSIVLEIRFTRRFPMSPPFVRVIRPRFLPFMHGGGGHVTAGGAMCMELLTNTGWSPANSLESVLLQVRLAICTVDPRPARLESASRQQRQYGVLEAIEAYKRAASTHGWEIPKDLSDLYT